MTVPIEQLTAQIARGADAMGISLSDSQQQQLMAYLELLIKWNRAYNLTAIRDPQQMVALHLLDSLVVHAHLGEAKRLIDVGTGPGLPGIVLAIMNPERTFTLLDSNGKKTRFLFQAKTSLKLDNVEIINDRVEAYQPDDKFEVVVSRAFASLRDMTYWCQHLLADKGHFLAMKGMYPTEELAAISHEYKLTSSARIDVPGVEGERHLLTLFPLSPNRREELAGE